MKASKLVEQITEMINNVGDNDIYLLSSIDEKGTYAGVPTGVSLDANGGIVLNTDISSICLTSMEKDNSSDKEYLKRNNGWIDSSQEEICAERHKTALISDRIYPCRGCDYYDYCTKERNG